MQLYVPWYYLSPAISKVLESILLLLYDDFLTSDSLQFGFKKNSSCIHALFTVNESVKYFTTRGSKVYCAFLDATKAFDKVLHNGLHMKLLQRGAPVTFIRLLQYWYSNLQCQVKWNNVLGESFDETFLLVFFFLLLFMVLLIVYCICNGCAAFWCNEE